MDIGFRDDRVLIRRRDRVLARTLEGNLLSFSRGVRPLPGIRGRAPLRVLVAQLVDSSRRIRYVARLLDRDISPSRANPQNLAFDPLRASILHSRAGNLDEAFWLVFFYVHFGKHRRGGWRYAREVYGRFDASVRWDWASTSANPLAFRAWLFDNVSRLRRPGATGGFGNHRKYESLDAYSPRGTGSAFQSYVEWVCPPRTHSDFFAEAVSAAYCDVRVAFDWLYHSMDSVASFGRMAKFDYLTMIGKLGLSAIVPGSAYIQHSTGPRQGAQMLFAGNNPSLSPRELDHRVIELDNVLGVGFQVLEDALCNWQKSPCAFRPFRG